MSFYRGLFNHIHGRAHSQKDGNGDWEGSHKGLHSILFTFAIMQGKMFHMMKRWIPTIAAFMVGMAVASVVWWGYLVKFQIQMAAVITTLHANQGEMGEAMLRYLDNPEATEARCLSFAASNWIKGYCNSIQVWDKHYPWLGVGRNFADAHGPSIKRLEEFMRERQSRSMNIGERDSAANRRQPVRSDTNQTSAVAGSGR